MDKDKENKTSIQKKIACDKYICSQISHLNINQKKCSKCKEKTCLYICPANVYNLDDITGDIVVQYENCLECGACRIACPKKNIKCEYPSAGCGVDFKNS